jgi:hypothetical protein
MTWGSPLVRLSVATYSIGRLVCPVAEGQVPLRKRSPALADSSMSWADGELRSAARASADPGEVALHDAAVHTARPWQEPRRCGGPSPLIARGRHRFDRVAGRGDGAERSFRINTCADYRQIHRARQREFSDTNGTSTINACAGAHGEVSRSGTRKLGPCTQQGPSRDGPRPPGLEMGPVRWPASRCDEVRWVRRFMGRAANSCRGLIEFRPPGRGH